MAFIVISWSRLPCEVVSSLSLEVIKQGFDLSRSARDAVNIPLKLVYI